MIRRHWGQAAAMLTVLALAACDSLGAPRPPIAPSAATAPSATSAPMLNQAAALFYSNSPTFAIRIGGIYSVAADAAGAKSPAPLFTRRGAYYNDLAALGSGAVAFTAQGPTETSKAIQVLDEGSPLPRTTVTDVAAAAQGPVWAAGDFVAYLDTSPESALVVTDLDNRNPKLIDTGVDSFAWAP